MSQTPRDAVMHEYVKVLKRPAIGREYLALARQARDGGWEYEEFLKELLEREMHSRYEHTAAMRLKQVRFPEVKTLAPPRVDRPARGLTPEGAGAGQL
jgi:DNA replication protein DnaC